MCISIRALEPHASNAMLGWLRLPVQSMSANVMSAIPGCVKAVVIISSPQTIWRAVNFDLFRRLLCEQASWQPTQAAGAIPTALSIRFAAGAGVLDISQSMRVMLHPEATVD